MTARKRYRDTMPTSFSISSTGKKTLEKLSAYYGINKTAVIEMILRKEARAIGILFKGVPGKDEDGDDEE